VGDDSDPDTSRSFHEKLLNIVYWFGMAVSLELISFGVCCHLPSMRLCGSLSFSFPSVLG